MANAYPGALCDFIAADAPTKPFAFEYFAQLVRYFYFIFFNHCQFTSLYILLGGSIIENAETVVVVLVYNYGHGKLNIL